MPDAEEKKECKTPSIFSFYRAKRPEKFSDSVDAYEMPLTEELFEQQLALLSTKKKQSLFENFVVAVAKRQITPNIKTQTGPDGGGDGKVDAETYCVSDDISDKWFSAEELASGKERWAFAISCKKQWKSKVEHDVENIVGTDRGYTRVLFFTNQLVKASTRLEVEQSLTEKYGVKVEIYDGLWLKNSVFQDKCMDLALEYLGLSDEYKKHTLVVGPNDKTRQERLEEIEKRLLRHVEGLDTGYVDELRESCWLSRGLEHPRVEVEGRFNRAMRECQHHGSTQQMFLLIYDHAWTSFFWYEDVETTYNDFQKLKPYVESDCTITRLEKLTNILTNLVNAAKAGLYDQKKIKLECDFIKDFEKRLEADAQKPSCLLFLRIYLAEQRLIGHIQQRSPIDEDIVTLRPLLLESASHLEISFETNYEIIEMLSNQIDENQEFDDLVDEMADVLAERRSSVDAAELRFSRAVSQFNKRNWKSVIKHLGFCVYAYEQEEYQDELIKSSAFMGLALSYLNLSYSAEAYLLKAVAFLMKNFYSTGVIQKLLVSVLQELCRIELRLGRIVMYWNWFELLNVIAYNGQLNQEESFDEVCRLQDAAWACRLSVSDLRQPSIAKLPDVFDRMGMFTCSEYLKFVLGYPEDVDGECLLTIQEMVKSSKIQEQPVFEQFLDKLNISTEGQAYLKTNVHNFTITIMYENDCETQQLAEIFLASIESFFATFNRFDVVAIDNEINIHVVSTTEDSEICRLGKNSEYELKVNRNDFTDAKCWECFATFISHLLICNSITREKIESLLKTGQSGERLMDRVTILQHTKFAMLTVLGRSFKYRLEDWIRDTDKIYSYKGKQADFAEKDYLNRFQLDTTTIKINTDMHLWDDAGWKGCGFIHDQYGMTPPVFGLAFANLSRGKAIVSEWKPINGETQPLVKIYIVKGIDANHPAHYRVCVAPIFSHKGNDEQRFIVTMCRKHTMTPTNNENLARFEEQYKRFGGCWLMAFQITENNMIDEPDSFADAFKYTGVEFRDAYMINVTDEARVALEPDDVPLIPDDAKDSAPVLMVMKELAGLN